MKRNFFIKIYTQTKSKATHDHLERSECDDGMSGRHKEGLISGWHDWNGIVLSIYLLLHNCHLSISMKRGVSTRSFVRSLTALVVPHFNVISDMLKNSYCCINNPIKLIISTEKITSAHSSPYSICICRSPSCPPHSRHSLLFSLSIPSFSSIDSITRDFFGSSTRWPISQSPIQQSDTFHRYGRNDIPCRIHRVYKISSRGY